MGYKFNRVFKLPQKIAKLLKRKEVIRQKEELDRLLKIAGQLPGVIYQYRLYPDGSSCFPFASDAIREIYHVTPREVREDASAVFKIIHPDDLANVVSSIQVSAQQLTPWKHEFRVKFTDGTIRKLYGNASPQRDDDGSVLWHGFITDITEQRQTEAMLRESEHQRSSILNDSPDVIWSLQWPDLKVNYISPSVEQVFGRPVSDFIANPSLWADVVHPEDKNMSENAFKQLHEKGNAVRECRIIRPDGTVVWINDKSKIIVDRKGDPIRIDGVSRDISERKQAEEDLRIKEERYRLLAENSSDVIWTMNLDGTMTYISPSVERLRGFTVEEAMNQPLDKILTPDSQTVSVDYVQRLYAAFVAGLPLPDFRGELEYYCKDGSTLWTECLTYPIPGSDGKSVSMLGVTRDITERKHAEVALRKSEEDFKAIANYAASWEAWFNLEGKLIWMNPFSLKLTGFTPEDYMHSENFLAMFSHPDDLEMVSNYFQGAMQGERGENVEVRALRKDGTDFWLSISWQQMLDSNGVSIGFRTSANDISERKRIENALKESEKRYRLLIETANEGIFVAQNGRLKFVNPIIPEMFGYSSEEIAEIPFLELVHPEDRERVGNNHLKRLKGELVESRYHFRILKKDGSIKWIVINAAKIVWEGQPATLNMISDITDSKMAELEIKHKNEELQKLISEREKFFSIIAHDLRGPLGGFMGITEMMADESQNFTEAERKEISLELSQSARNTFNLLENLLEWSQTDRGQTVFNPQNLDLMEAIPECVNLAEEQARRKNISIAFHNHASQEVFTDRNMVQTVIRNLLTNAVKFTPEGGKITISSDPAENNMIVIGVKDSGIGMTNTMLNNLFRIDSSTKRPGTNGEKSTGLGLLLCKEFVEMQGGKIWVESELHNGSVFYFTIPTVGEPKSKDPVETVVLKEDQISHLRKLKILIAEDDEISAKLISFMVKELSRQVLIVKTGADAVETCRNNPDIDIVLMDIAMPVMDGFEATRLIREFNKDIIIIAQTTFSQKTDKEKAQLAGCNDYLEKPLSPERITGIIKKHFKG